MFAERLISLLKEKGISQLKFVSDLGIGRNQVRYWADHGNVPSATTVNAIADYLDTTPDYLTGKTDVKEKPATDTGYELGGDIAHLMSVLSEMSKEDKQKVLEYAELLKNRRTQ